MQPQEAVRRQHQDVKIKQMVKASAAVTAAQANQARPDFEPSYPLFNEDSPYMPKEAPHMERQSSQLLLESIGNVSESNDEGKNES